VGVCSRAARPATRRWLATPGRTGAALTDAHFHAYHEDFAYYEDRARGLLASAQDATAAALAAFTRSKAPLTEQGARTVVASEHGFKTWAGLRRHVARLRDTGAPFACAYRAIEARDLDGLREQLDRAPELVHAQGTNGNDLLGMAGATRDHRLSTLLLQRGADPARANAHGWTALHQAAYSDHAELAQELLDHGAPTDVSARGDGGTPLVVALFWGNVGTAELLAHHGVHPRNLRTAAGLGDPELLGALLHSGQPTAAASEHRGFYRPHSGFPAWRPANDRQEVLDEALAWAARSDRADALATLVDCGAIPDADVYRGTPLCWAAARGRVAAIRGLVALGADPSARSTFGGPGHGRALTALHLAAQDGHIDAVRALLELGADPRLEDAIYESSPAGWAEHFGHEEAATLIRTAEARR
jgi:ankyrin repeat protein